MPQRLSGLDATFLYMETPTQPMHVMGVLVLDTSTIPGGYAFGKIRAVLEGRIHLMPAFRRLLVPVPGGVAHPVWIRDGGFDLDNHLRRIGAPPPGDQRALEQVVGDIASTPLDRSKPLWEMWVVEGLHDEQVAIVTKIHHATIDGTSGADVMIHLLDLTPEVAQHPPPEEPFLPEERPSGPRLLAGALAAQAGTPLRAGRALGKLAGNATSTARTLARGGGSGAPMPFSAPRTRFSGALSRHRAVAFGKASLDDLKEIKAAFDGKVNDVVLAIATHAMRGYLEWLGELPDRPLVASSPISVRKESDPDQKDSANQVSSMLVGLPVHEPDPVEQLRIIVETTKRSKELAAAIGAETLMDWAEFLAPRLFTSGMRLYSSMRLADRHRPALNLIVSNVPGPPIPLYSAGARVDAIYPMGPLLPGAGINITVLSNMGDVDFGIIADRETVPEVWRLAEGLSDGIDRLLKAARASKRPPRLEAPRPEEAGRAKAAGDSQENRGREEAGVSPAVHRIQGREIAMPVVVREARSWAAAFSVSAAAAERVIEPTGLRVLRTRPGRTLVTLIFADYLDGDLDRYHEAGVSFLVHPHDRARATDLVANRACVYIHRLPVDQTFTLEAGREIWGYPKTLAGIGIASIDGRTTCAVAEAGVEIFTLTVRDGGVRMPAQSPPTYTFLDGVLRRTEWEVSGAPRGRLGGGDVHLGSHPMAEELRGLGLKRRAVFTQSNPAFAARFGPAEVVQA